jgi:hypothetical protein
MEHVTAQRVPFRIPTVLAARLRDRSRLKGQRLSAMVRAALENYLGYATAFDHAKAAKLIGCVSHSPKDLSTNPRCLAGFGERDSRDRSMKRS